jgi:hypothetical protein
MADQVVGVLAMRWWAPAFRGAALEAALKAVRGTAAAVKAEASK